MKRITVVALVCMIMNSMAVAQDKLFETIDSVKPRHGFMLTGNGNFDVPAGDISKLFGLSYRAGFGVMYKTTKNFLWGVKFDFILGNDIKDDSVMINVRDMYNASPSGHYLEFINNTGNRIAIPMYERGYATGVDFGKIFTTNKLRPDNGIMEITTVGFMQYKIDIFDANNAVPQIDGVYKKGYDRLTNGLFAEQYCGYVYFSKSRLINFHLGLDALFGFTQDRRSYLYDVMRTDNKQRLDILFGIRGGWYIPMFKRKSEDILFE